MTDYTDLARRLREALENEYFSGDSTMVAKEDVHRAAEILKSMGQQEPYRYAYRYPDCIRFNDGSQVNGSDPIEAIPLYLHPQPTIPSGYKLVPIEPTPEMVQSGGHANSEWLNDSAPIGEQRYAMPMKSVWQAMLDAAPQPTQPQEQREPSAVPEDTVSNRRAVADQPGEAISIMQRQRQEIERLRVECDALRKDAERYRGIRSACIEVGENAVWTTLCNVTGAMYDTPSDTFDRRIDTALAQTGANDADR